MAERELVKLTRDCEAVLIPSGDGITLKEGQDVVITQSLGGSFTVIVLGNMARIDGKDADALGKNTVEEVPQPEAPSFDGVVTEESVWEQLKTCYDPEIPVNLVDLGLIYDLQISRMDNGSGYRVDIKMTLTAPGCGMGDSIATDARTRVMSIAGVTEAAVELVWEPMWNQGMMTEAARLQLGFM